MDDTLAIVNVMVALAVIIALIGIANTLALSVFERTRELGLVRAVGMTRRQLRRMVRFEAALVATFGAVLGVGIGLLFGYGVVGALPESLATRCLDPHGEHPHPHAGGCRCRGRGCVATSPASRTTQRPRRHRTLTPSPPGRPNCDPRNSVAPFPRRRPTMSRNMDDLEAL